jgi:hypothetical protein
VRIDDVRPRPFMVHVRVVEIAANLHVLTSQVSPLGHVDAGTQATSVYSDHSFGSGHDLETDPPHVTSDFSVRRIQHPVKCRMVEP